MTPAGLRHPGVLAALASAGLFGAAAPAAKQLLGAGVDPWILAGLLYTGSGVGMALTAFVTRCPRSLPSRSGLARLAGAIVLGGIVGPLLLMLGLQHLPAGQASLLLTTEGVLTAVLAWTFFREHVTRGLILGVVLITGGAVVLSRGVGAGPAPGSSWGMLAVIAACLCWALDNNLTRDVTGIEPAWLAATKGLVAGPVNLAIGLAAGAHPPAATTMATAALIGWACYGLSITLFIAALRSLGTARTGAYFGLAPFIGATLALTLGEPLTPTLLLAGVLMATGTYLHLAEDHRHRHTHPAASHDHPHRHDDGHHAHQHEHEHEQAHPHEHERGDDAQRLGALRHTHPHEHTPVTHSHRHYPDEDHRHRH